MTWFSKKLASTETWHTKWQKCLVCPVCEPKPVAEYNGCCPECGREDLVTRVVRYEATDNVMGDLLEGHWVQLKHVEPQIQEVKSE